MVWLEMPSVPPEPRRALRAGSSAGDSPHCWGKLLRENICKVRSVGTGPQVARGEQRGSLWEAGQSCVCWCGAAADLFRMPWAACGAADKHTGGENRSNNIEETLLCRERCTELQLLQPPALGQGPGSHPCHSHMALLHGLGATGIFMRLPRHPPLTLLPGAAKLAGWHLNERGCDCE